MDEHFERGRVQAKRLVERQSLSGGQLIEACYFINQAFQEDRRKAKVEHLWGWTERRKEQRRNLEFCEKRKWNERRK